MTFPEEFDILKSPLERINLIEASAGTGKTYNLTGLYIRLLLEKNLDIENILVVTFTKSATEELKQRIRDKIVKTIESLSLKSSEDKTVLNLIERLKDRSRALASLKTQLREFERAQIFTIHSFCMHILQDFAFETGSMFESEFIDNQSELLLETIEDYWRKNLNHESPLFLTYILSNNLFPENIMKLNKFQNIIQNQFLNINLPHKVPDPSEMEKEFIAISNQLKTLWHEERENIRQILESHNGLNQKIYKPKKIEEYLEDMEFLLELEPVDIFFNKDIDKLSMEKLIKSTKQSFTPPRHRFFVLYGRLIELKSSLKEHYDRKILSMLRALIEYVKKEIRTKKEKHNIRTYDDLLLLVYEALKCRRGGILKNALRQKYRAGLIDEFQDTEPIQYEIFKEIFPSGSGCLFLIGDPKQSIYGFRGADVFTYISATKEIESKFTLSSNWRARRGLISSINTIFSRKEDPFVFPDISYLPSSPASESQHNEIKIDGKDPRALTVWFLDSGSFAQEGKAINKEIAKETVFHAIAGEIIKIMELSRDGRASIKGRPIRASDFAILVTDNRYIKSIQDIFASYRIPCVLSTTISIFQTDEAIEILRILNAISNPGRKELIRSALSTYMIGLKGEDIERLNSNPDHWEGWITRFKELSHLWKDKGFMRVIQSLIGKEGILLNLAKYTNAERRLTNTIHLIEIINEHTTNKHLTITETVKWLSDQIKDPPSGAEDYQLRLETDEDAVKIVTVHKSKGLEYPIVFAPVGWEFRRQKKKDRLLTLYHDRKDNMKPVLETGVDNNSMAYQMSEMERLSEDIRLLYVAMTRAVYMCYIIWGKINTAENSALCYLLHNGRYEPLKKSAFKDMTDEEIFDDLIKLKDKCPDDIEIRAIPKKEEGKTLQEEKAPPSLTFRKFKGKIDKSWNLASFSSLIYRVSDYLDVADYDQMDLPDSDTIYEREDTKGIESFPRGARAGICIHKIMENLDFRQSNESIIRDLIKEQLSEHNFDLLWEDAVMDMIRNLLSINLLKHMPDLRLSLIPPKHRLNELEFYFPIKQLSAGRLKEIFTDNFRWDMPEEVPQHIGRLEFSPFRGFMKGFVDLVFSYRDRFFIIDWKTNYLGNHITDYNQSAMKDEMLKHNYFLQAIIYTIAVNNYLRSRIPDYSYERYFGGTLYLFVRGISHEAGPDYGIYHITPDGDAIERATSILMGDRR